MMSSKIYSNSVYSSGEAINQGGQLMPYIFRERSGKLRWKDLMRLDLEAMVRNNDISPLEPFLENLIFSSIDDNDLQMVPESSVLKLVKMHQYIMEFLLDSQQRLENENRTLETNYSNLLSESLVKENSLKQNKSLINSLKKDKKEKETVLNTYKLLLEEYKTEKVNNEKLNESSSSKKYYMCKMCEGKRFSSEEKLEAHMKRRHMVDEDSIRKEPNFDEKLDQMKTYFETYIKNFNNDSYMKIFENQKNLESKLNEIKYDKGSDIKDLENHFKNTLLEMKEMYIKNSLNIQSNQLGQSYINIKRDSDEDSEKLKKETQKMNEMLKEIMKEQHEKMHGLTEQFSQFKNKISDEFKEIKHLKNLKTSELVLGKAENMMIEQHHTVDNSVTKKLVKKSTSPRITQAESIQIGSTPNKKEKEIIIDTTVQTSIQKKKTHFNAGPLESDSDSEFDKMKNLSVSMQKQEEMIFSFAPDKKIKIEEKPTVVEQIKVVEVIQAVSATNEPSKQMSSERGHHLRQSEQLQNVKENINHPMPKPAEKPKEDIVNTGMKDDQEVKTIKEADNSNAEQLLKSDQDIKQSIEVKEVQLLKAKLPKVNKEEDKIKNREKLENFFHKFYDRDNITLHPDQSKIFLLHKEIMYYFII